MPLSLYNTLTRRKQPFEPIDPGKVRMYSCGVTVYDYCHLGHARSYIVWDTIRRYLTWRGFDVTYVQNFTDIDDKIINRACEEGLPWNQITEKYIQAYKEDMARLNILPADAYPQATKVIPQIIALIKTLIEQGFAYAVNGDVYYAVERFPTYGKLSGRQLDQMEAGASGRVDEEAEVKKRHPLDFALWKAAKPGEPEWESPWGKGRPGWHIECSAMVRELLGDRIDIHTGGEDLIFPHHENEIAQSEAVLAQPLARYWMHNGFVKIRGDKMSKSLKNFTTIRALLENTDPMVLRLFVLQAHYRKPIDFTEEAMSAAENGWKTLRESLLFGYDHGSKLGWGDPSITWDKEKLDANAVEHFQALMDDDFNTSGGLAVLFELAKGLQRERNILKHEGRADTEPQILERQWHTLTQLARVLGLEIEVVTASGNSVLSSLTQTGTAEVGPSDAEIEAKIQQRQDARKAKNFAEADRIRKELEAQSIKLIDQPGGITRWVRD